MFKAVSSHSLFGIKESGTVTDVGKKKETCEGRDLLPVVNSYKTLTSDGLKTGLYNIRLSTGGDVWQSLNVFLIKKPNEPFEVCKGFSRWN